MNQADDLLAMLSAKHDQSKAVFVPECKTGEAGSRRLDAWVLLKTWSPPTAIGYEVKVSRSDFLGDRKWPEYLPLCHEFYFVCPAKLIAVEELPENVGLLWTAGSRLVTKRKAARREPDPVALCRLMSYVLMSRSRVVGDMWEANRADPKAQWRAWLSEREDGQRLGRDVSERIRRIVSAARSAQQRAETERDRLKGVEAKLEALGFPRDADSWTVDRQLGDGHLRDRLRRVQTLAAQITNIAGQP